MADKAPLLSGMDTRQKVTAGIVGVVVLIVIWQVWGLFSGGGGSSTPPARTTQTTAPSANVQMAAPKPAQAPVPQYAPQTPEEQAMLKMQADAQQQYLKALTQLQMLRIAANISETNKTIMANKLDTVKSEKDIVELLSSPAQPTPSYSAALSQQQATTTTTTTKQTTPPPVIAPEISYTVVSVTQTHDIWNAVIGSAGSLYNVKVGDVLPPDGSTVTAISRNGVTLEKEGARRRISLVPII